MSALSVGKIVFASNAIAIDKCICFVDDITMYVIDLWCVVLQSIVPASDWWGALFQTPCHSRNLNCPFYCPTMTEIKDAALLDFIRFCT